MAEAGGGAAEGPVAGVTLARIEPAAQVLIRGPGADAGFRAAVAGAIGVEPPTAPNTVHGAPGLHLLWLGPSEWLAVADAPGARLAARLEEALGRLPPERFATVVDLSDARSAFELAGPRARDVLAKGCPLDLHPRTFGPGRCARTQLARTSVLVHQTDSAPTFRLFARISFTDYVAAWLEDAIAEFGR